MKKVIKTMMMMLVASAFVLTSCKDKDETEPTIADVKLTINPSAEKGTHFVGDSLKIVVNAVGNAENNLKKMTVTKQVTGKATETLVTETLTGTDKVYTLTDIFKEEDASKDITYSIKVEGAVGTAQTINYVAKVYAVMITDVLDQDREVGSQLNENPGEHFGKLTSDWDIFDNNASASAWESSIDFAFYYGGSGYTIASPSYGAMQQQVYKFIPADKARNTGFYKLTASEMSTGIYQQVATDVDDRKLIVFAEGKTYTNVYTGVTTGDVYLYKTKEGKIGLLKVSLVRTAVGQGGATANSTLNYQAVVQRQQ